jgi:photosystem II stability/assembly factor-like uncharacterized protein
VNKKWWILICLLLPGMLSFCSREGDIQDASHNSSEPIPLFSFRDKFYGTCSSDTQNIWVVGHLGKMFHSSDGAKTWEMQETNVLEPLFDVDFVDTRHGWAVGNLGLVLHTSDGGKTWEKQDAKSDKQFFRVDFVNEHTGWVVGYYGTILHTSDGGQTWDDQSIAEDIALNGVDFVDHETGWVVGEFGTILRTNDAGMNWEKLAGAVEEELLDQVAEEGDSGLGEKTLFGVTFENKMEGWVAGMDGTVAHTADGGVHWTAQQTGVMTNLYDVHVRGSFGVAVGALGAILITRDGGKEWNEFLSDSVRIYNWLTGVDILENGHALITGGHGTLLSIKEEDLSKVLGLSRGSG